MKWLLVIFGGAVFTAFAWRISQILSADAIGMAIGMTLGVLAGVPAAALILLARRRDDEDSDAGYGPPVTIDQYPPVNPYGYTQAPPPVVIVCKEDVTPYYNGARRLMGMEPLPSRADLEPTTLTAQQISELEAYIDAQKNHGIRQVDPRQFRVKWSGE